jgi:hypothetical protein
MRDTTLRVVGTDLGLLAAGVRGTLSRKED